VEILPDPRPPTGREGGEVMMSLVEFVNTYLLSDNTAAILICLIVVVAAIWIGLMIFEIASTLLK